MFVKGRGKGVTKKTNTQNFSLNCAVKVREDLEDRQYKRIVNEQSQKGKGLLTS